MLTPPKILWGAGLKLFLKVFEKEIKKTDEWKNHPGISQLLINRSASFVWDPTKLLLHRKRAAPFIELFEEAYAKDSQKTVSTFSEIASSYADIQHSAFSRDVDLKKNDDFVKHFNELFDEYRFRYEELLNRLMAITYSCIGIVVGKPPTNGTGSINVDANKKVEQINASILPSSASYEKVNVSIAGIKPGIRNALSHGGRRYQVPDEEKFQLEDRSGWKQVYTLLEFRKELEVLNEVIDALELGLVVIQMNHIREISEFQIKSLSELSQQDKSNTIDAAARTCQFLVLDAESKSPYFHVKLQFDPRQHRESEVFGNLYGATFKEKIPAQPIILRDQVFRFSQLISLILEDATPGISVDVFTYGDKQLLKIEINDLKGFLEASREIKSHEDYVTKKTIEDQYVKLNRYAWEVGELKDDGKPITDEDTH